MSVDYAKVFCRACGQEVHPEAEICPKCGVRQKNNFMNEVSGKLGDFINQNKKTALPTVLLCFFLGCFGAHRFYVGRTSSAVAMLIVGLASIFLGLASIFLWWLGLPWIVFGIWWFVDLIMIILEKFRDSQGAQVRW